ncbi:hypothetical protein D9758_002752 [Tetrapyrgos nigripes]|uniref:Phosphoglycerate mutase-like protein n=1 Tax=Tetrapyrgos nigripes TaxID=182062 RepID=A0A8H5GQP6_9AGAR|nr:hypothetical protein D9758_002752 [Tetrapyrgos nigripes]
MGTGMKQAKSLGKWFMAKGTQFNVIYSSDLQRAVTTAEAILEDHSDPRPPFIQSLNLREQNFGQGEGQPYKQTRDPKLTAEEHYARGLFPHIRSRTERFPGGESKDDLARRAEGVVDEIIVPCVLEAAKEKRMNYHVAIVSHGLFIKELILVLLKRNPRGGGIPEEGYRGLRNTGWSRVVVGIEPEVLSSTKISKPLPLLVRITQINRHDHLDSVVRQKGGIGSIAHDAKQKDIRGFFASRKA